MMRRTSQAHSVKSASRGRKHMRVQQVPAFGDGGRVARGLCTDVAGRVHRSSQGGSASCGNSSPEPFCRQGGAPEGFSRGNGNRFVL